MKHYRAIFLDWDDTIGDWAGSAEQAQRFLYEQEIRPLFAAWSTAIPSFDDYLAYYRAHNIWLWEEYSAGHITREYLHTDQFLTPICHYLGISSEQADEGLRQLSTRLGDEYIRLTMAASRLTEDAAEVVHYLAAKYPLTIVSNGYVEMQYHKLEQSGLKECFRHLVFSEEVGAMKPDPRIMEVALARNQRELPDLKASEVVMIGDSYSSDIAGAQAAGIDTIWWLREGTQATDEQRRSATYIISSLRDVMTIL
ncbi:MAG: YjjG family noncanonical pyrimidine nucleotidase [Paludibacteraceae bacterium]|nr:YjjG family noncanonical pyrimidine nucleotidase [Paludibacteraceae bacterium]